MRDFVLKVVFSGLLVFASGLTRGQQMAVTFDDLPVHGAMPQGLTRLEITQAILKTLQRERLPAVYGFINGGRGEEDPSSLSVLKTWVAAGQPLGNHTWAHLDLNKETPEEFELEVLRNEPLLESLIGEGDWHWLRYPYLHEGDTVEKRRAVRAWLFAHGYKIAQVSMDFEDYLWNDPYARCVAKHDRASIQKLHDTYLAVADQYYGVFRKLSQLVYGRDVKYVLLMHVGAFDARMLPELLALYRAKGVKFINLSDAMSDPAYRDRSGHRGTGGRGVSRIDDATAKAQLAVEHQAVQGIAGDVPVKASFDRCKQGTGSPFELLLPDADWTIFASAPQSGIRRSQPLRRGVDSAAGL